MAKINLDRVLGHYVESVLADKDYENGALVGLGDLVEGEDRLYNAVTATADNYFLVTEPEVDPTKKASSDSLDFVIKKGKVMRVHRLEVGATVTVEQKLHADSLQAKDTLTIQDGKFVKGEGDFKLELVTVIGADRRPAYRIRRVK
ncbi:hypothetical protein [Staphylococcus delphini]|uniref:Phage protein n=1 Tax=Staphylococcus delphini TaxID=53344 RepID=A0AAX0QTE9_9STAP|nr:hypothetical protein [Staphylococcus delphini]PCF50166.1 hypothetical protein B5C07_08130 [Staphylococcus delphini]PNZ95986.1 hypothetical protein CD148_02330 [Staphylococcus delphini]RIZ56202.1 hypothetical protein CDL68_01295 [Staphylococcus delphini]VED62428.1 phage protein [Staphylococcus delphini]